MNNFNALSNQARLVIIFMGLAGLLSVAWSALAAEMPQYGQLALLVLLGAVTARGKVKLSKTSTLSLLTSVVMLSLMLGGIITAVAVGITGVTIQALLPSRKFVPHRFVFNAAMVVLAIHAASVPYYWISARVQGQLLGIIAASIVYYLGNSLSVSLIVAVTECKPIFRVWFDHFLPAAPSFLSAGLLSLAVIEVMTRTPAGVVVLLPLACICYYVVRLAERRAVLVAQ